MVLPLLLLLAVAATWPAVDAAAAAPAPAPAAALDWVAEAEAVAEDAETALGEADTRGFRAAIADVAAVDEPDTGLGAEGVVEEEEEEDDEGGAADRAAVEPTGVRVMPDTEAEEEAVLGFAGEASTLPAAKPCKLDEEEEDEEEDEDEEDV